MANEYRPRRSALYMPGANEKALAKAKSLPADAVIFDCEDSVAPDMKAVAREAKDRFETAEEFLLALERGASRPVAAPGRQPLAQKNPLLLWKIVAAVSLAVNFVLLLTLLR